MDPNNIIGGTGTLIGIGKYLDNKYPDQTENFRQSLSFRLRMLPGSRAIELGYLRAMYTLISLPFIPFGLEMGSIDEDIREADREADRTMLRHFLGQVLKSLDVSKKEKEETIDEIINSLSNQQVKDIINDLRNS